MQIMCWMSITLQNVRSFIPDQGFGPRMGELFRGLFRLGCNMTLKTL